MRTPNIYLIQAPKKVEPFPFLVSSVLKPLGRENMTAVSELSNVRRASVEENTWSWSPERMSKMPKCGHPRGRCTAQAERKGTTCARLSHTWCWSLSKKEGVHTMRRIMEVARCGKSETSAR